jgi:DNA-directed RNA polymerase specialized sigma24 family protein
MSKHQSHIVDDEEFFSDVRERISLIFRKRIHSDDAEELVQTAMVEIRSRVADLANESDLLPAVFEVVRNTIREHCQEQKRQKVVEFSTDALYYYQPEMTEADWKSIVTKAMKQLKEEQPGCAEMLQAATRVSTMEELSANFEMERFNADQMLLRCRTALLKVITENLKTPLP